jgi:hypothetical protein
MPETQSGRTATGSGCDGREHDVVGTTDWLRVIMLDWPSDGCYMKFNSGETFTKCFTDE